MAELLEPCGGRIAGFDSRCDKCGETSSTSALGLCLRPVPFRGGDDLRAEIDAHNALLRSAKASALREAADDADRVFGTKMGSVGDWLRKRAEKIEGGGE